VQGGKIGDQAFFPIGASDLFRFSTPPPLPPLLALTFALSPSLSHLRSRNSLRARCGTFCARRKLVIQATISSRGQCQGIIVGSSPPPHLRSSSFSARFTHRRFYAFCPRYSFFPAAATISRSICGSFSFFFLFYFSQNSRGFAPRCES
jgi:hypothetical protein